MSHKRNSEDENFWWAVGEAYRLNGGPPSDVEHPRPGDLRDHPIEGHQVWTGTYWHPTLEARNFDRKMRGLH